jgi:Predicted transcriptional regulator
MTGRGDIYAPVSNVVPIKTIPSNAEPISPDHIIYVPLVNQYAYAGYMCGYADAEYIETLPRIPFIVDHEAHGNYMAFEVKGDSMDDGTTDSLIEGDRLLCREIKPEFWIECKLHIRKWDFVIVHKEGILVKRITEHDVQNRTIKIHSLNPFYEDRIIQMYNIYFVKSIFMPKISAIDCNVSKPTLKAPFSIRDIACCLVFIFSANSACDIPACSRS